MPRSLILLALGLPLWAQPQPVSPADATEQATVAALLKSPDLGQLAWGAQLAANYQQRKFIPEIIPLLNFLDADVQLSAFDALIRLNADVPEQSLANFLDDRQTLEPTIVLLARDPKAHAALLMHALNQPLSNLHWAAVNSLLATASPPGYASLLLKDWTVKETIPIIDDSLGMGVGGSIGCGDGGLSNRPGFPAIYFYSLYEGSRPAATLIVAGPHPISYIRQSAPRHCETPVDRDRYRLDYLRSMARMDSQSPEGALPQAPVIHWAGAEDYVTKTSAYLQSLRVFLTNLRSRLTQAGVLTDSGGQEGPTLEINVDDQRRDRTMPLPVVDWSL